MAHAGVKNAYRATIHTWRWAWHLKPRVVRHLSTALSTSVTTNSLKLIMNDPFWEFVQLHSAEYRACVHWKRWLTLCFKSMLSRIVISKNEASRKALQCLVKGKLCSVWNIWWTEHWLQAFCGINGYVRRALLKFVFSEMLYPQHPKTKHFVV